MYRQGDVLVIPTRETPSRLVEQPRDGQGRIALAHGEVTGHAHAIHDGRVKMFLADEGRGVALLDVPGDKPAPLVHEEHTTHMIPPGRHEVRRQLEYGEQDVVREVAD